MANCFLHPTTINRQSPAVKNRRVPSHSGGISWSAIFIAGQLNPHNTTISVSISHRPYPRYRFLRVAIGGISLFIIPLMMSTLFLMCARQQTLVLGHRSNPFHFQCRPKVGLDRPDRMTPFLRYLFGIQSDFLSSPARLSF